MKIKLFKSVMLASALVAGVLPAHAATFTMIGGTNINFFYDKDFWSGSTASVANNVLTFTHLDGFVASAAGERYAKEVKVFDSSGSYTNPYGVVAVAKNGYKVSNNVVLGATGAYTLAAKSGKASVTSSADVYSGTFSGGTSGVFSQAKYITNNVASESHSSTNIAASGSFNATSPNQHVLSSSRVLGLDTYLAATANEPARSLNLTSTSSLSTVSYGFKAISAIPEPETYAMMLAGLGLLGFTASRKKQA